MADNWFDRTSFMIDENKQYIRYGIYCAALFGIGFSLRSLRLFKKFKSANAIPKSYINKHMKLSGKVFSVQVTTPVLLRVDHRPILGQKLRRSNRTLGIEISSIDISGNGISWLQHTLTNKDVDFTLLEKKDDYLTCIVEHNKQDVAEILLKLGFATAMPFNVNLEHSKQYVKYYKKLLKAENIVEKTRTGMWSGKKVSTMEYLKEVLDKLYNIIIRIR